MLVATSYADCQRHGHQGDVLKALSRKVNKAIQSAPSVFCIDEIDSFTHRTFAPHSNNYILDVANGLVKHLSKLNQTHRVIVIGATTHPDLVDPAILRPGRFDLHLEMRPTDRAGIIRLLRKELQSAQTTFDAKAEANHLLGASAAQVTAVIRDAKGLARSQAAPLAQQHLITAAEHLAPTPSLDILWRAAVHDAGHVVVAHVLGLPPAERATIDLPSTPLETRSSALNRVAALLVGRAAEEFLLGESSKGAGLGKGSDLEMATQLVGRMLFEWGLGDQLMHAAHPALTASTTDKVEPLLQAAHNRAAEIIEMQRPLVIKLAEDLLSERELPSERLQEFLQDNQRTRPPS